jgi:hypothetical protein
MSGFETGKRVGFTKLEIDRLRRDFEEWNLNHNELTQSCWPWEDLIAKANFVFGRITKLDMDVQLFLFKSPDASADPELMNVSRETTAAWLEVSVPLLEHSEQLVHEYGSVDGRDELKTNVRRARAALTSDEEYFDSDELAEARDKAIDSHRAGLTEPLLEANGNVAE